MSSVAPRVSVKVLRSHQKANSRSRAFDVHLKVDKFRGKEIVFAQGDAPKNVMYIQEGDVKLTVVNGTGKGAVVGILDREIFLGSSYPERNDPVRSPERQIQILSSRAPTGLLHTVLSRRTSFST